MTWSPDDGHGAPPPPQPSAPPPVETYGQGMPQVPPQEAVTPLGAPPPMLTKEQVEAALENAKRVRQLRLDALSIALRNESREDAVTTLHGSEAPYFSEWFLHDLWAITGGGRLSCIQPPTRCELDGGHFYYSSTWRAEHRYFGAVDGFGIGYSGDKYLGTNEGGKQQKRQLEAVSPHSIAQHASTRAKRNAMEELLGTQGWSWDLLRRLRAGESVNLPDLEAAAAPQAAQAPAGGPPPPAPAAAPPPPGPPPQQPAGGPPGPPPPPQAQAQAPAQPDVGALTQEQVAAKEPPEGWRRTPGPQPESGPEGREPVLTYIGRLVRSGVVTPEELLAHARLREGYQGANIREAPEALQGEVAWACCQDVSWVKAAKRYLDHNPPGVSAGSIEDDIPF